MEPTVITNYSILKVILLNKVVVARLALNGAPESQAASISEKFDYPSQLFY